MLGLITLLVFPLPTFWVLNYFEEIPYIDILQLDQLDWRYIGAGLILGGLYAFLALFLMKAKVFESMPNRIEKVVREMQLNIFDALFISICAGVGEELLFRAGVQYYAGPLITSVIFIAIHGYLNPFNWKMSLYGLIVLPFILLISYSLPYLGIWFCIAAHFCYDLILFVAMSKDEPNAFQYEDDLSEEPTCIEEEL